MANTKSDAAKTREVEEMIRRARHPAERPLSIISGILTLGILAFLLWLVISVIRKPADESQVVSFLASFLAIDESTVSDLLKMGAWAVLVIFLWVVIRYVVALMKERSRAEDEDFTAEEMKTGEAKEIANRYAEILGMEELPELFFSEKSKQVEVDNVKAYGESYIVIPMNTVSYAVHDERKVALRFSLASSLGSICMGHYSLLFQVLTVSGRVLPVFKGLYNKALVYSADRMAMEILKRDPDVQLTSEEVSKELFIGEYIRKSATMKVVDMDKTLQNRRESFQSEGRISQAMSRLGEDEPLLVDRINALEDPSKPGPLI